MGALLLSALALGGCSISIADLPLVGTPADAPARPKETGAYLPVNELPPDREEAAMNAGGAGQDPEANWSPRGNARPPQVAAKDTCGRNDLTAGATGRPW